ncbi:hypothetical protein DOTSEDRAFT_72295 [Dothistroma septosporum NZE10]|uniref:Uncharacterized protein n=1 Tax=Dothistroma septosporum (strain NZE10 / CBS 128990) TaxID=675120 RepID=N1PPE6_DOTSN|nr:hypothetical protein DOTSEDRAFT_72295 [Dothistroma septosporum NZE10]
MFGWVCHRWTNEREGMHICILDTKKLPDAQIVLHVRAMHTLLSDEISEAYDHELLGYGPLTAPAYKAVSFDDFDMNELGKFFPGVKEDMFNPKLVTTLPTRVMHSRSFRRPAP